MLDLSGRYQEAWGHARQAVALYPDSINCQWAVGWTSLRLERWQEALDALKKACEGTSTKADHCAAWAIALWRAGRHEQAREVAEEAASMPEMVQAVLKLGFYHAQAGDRTEALRYLRRYLELRPKFTPQEARYLGQEPLLAPLRGDPDLEAIVAEVRRRAEPSP